MSVTVRTTIGICGRCASPVAAIAGAGTPLGDLPDPAQRAELVEAAGMCFPTHRLGYVIERRIRRGRWSRTFACARCLAVAVHFSGAQS